MMDSKPTSRGFVLYALACMVVIGLAGGVLMSVLDGPDVVRAVWVTALVAFVVQMVAFAIARIFAEKGNGFAGWGVGALICLLALIVYGLASPALGLPLSASLLSLATYFSLTELIEAPFLFL